MHAYINRYMHTYIHTYIHTYTRIYRWSLMTVPVAAGLYEFFTRTGIFDFIAGIIEIGCNTWDHKTFY